MKPFNLQEALAGKPVVTRDGRKVARVVHFPKVSSAVWRVVGAIDDGAALPVSEEGAYFDNDESPNDLFMASEKKEGWVNLFKSSQYDLRAYCSPDGYGSTHVFETEKAAREHAVKYPAIATVRIEWEE